MLRMRPGYIVWGGFLHVWVNKRFWCQTPGMDDDMRHALMAGPVGPAFPAVELRRRRANYIPM